MAHREFRDARGKRWEVWDVFPSQTISGQDPGTLLNEDAARGWLAFRSGQERRRFFGPPPDWDSLSDEQLALLCHHATAF